MLVKVRSVAIAACILLVLALAVMPFLPKKAQAEDSVGRVISVNGQATIQVKPDQATISFGVETNGSTAKDAQASNNTLMTKVVDALKNAGIPSEDIQTTNFSLHPVYESQGDKPDGKQVLSGYRCNNTVSVRAKDIAKVGSLIDAAISAGATNVGGISFGLQDPDSRKSDALSEAVKDARSKAEVMAKAAGVTITGIKSISDGNITVSDSYARMGVALQDSTPIESGTVTVVSSVRVEFTF